MRALALILMLAACSSEIDGPEQIVTLITNPDGAACEVAREEEIVARVPFTPATLRISTRSRPLSITCRAPGLAPVRQTVAASAGLGAGGRVVLGGTAGHAFDAAVGNRFHYPQTIVVTLSPVTPPGRPLPLAR